MNKDLVVAHIHKGILCTVFLIALELGKRKTEVPGEKLSGGRQRTNNKLNHAMVLPPGGFS